MAIFGPKPWVNHFRKMSVFNSFKILVFIAQKGIFSFQNIVMKFSWFILLKKKKVGKKAIFGPKPWVNPLRKISIFRLLKLLVFIAKKGVFLDLEYRKRNFPGLYCLKKKLEKWPFLYQNHGLTPLQKCQFFDFLNLLIYSLKRRFFDLGYHKRNFPGLYYLKIKSSKNGHFWTWTF